MNEEWQPIETAPKDGTEVEAVLNAVFRKHVKVLQGGQP